MITINLLKGIEMSAIRNTKYCLVIVLTGVIISCGQNNQQASYPLGAELHVLSEDTRSQKYMEVLKTLTFQDLEEEWKRVATPDNYISFREKHGGIENILANPPLKEAYEARKIIADDFVILMLKAFTKLDREPTFTNEEVEEFLLATTKHVADIQNLNEVSIEYVMPVSGAEKQWPGFRGPTGQGIAQKKKFPLKWNETENIRWKAELPGRGTSSPVVWNKRVFITSASEDGKTRLLYCFNRSDGELLWKREAPTPQNIEKLYWKNTYATTTPITDGERVIAFFGNSGFICCDMNGDLEWSQNIGEFITTHGPGTNMVMYKDKIILIQDQINSESVYVAINKYNGDILWRQKRDQAYCWASPVIVRIDDHDELIYNGSHKVVGYNPDTGEEIWSLNGPSKEAVPMIVTGGGLIFSQSGRNGPIIAIRPGGKGDVTGSHLFWKNSIGGPHVPSPVYFQDRLYVINDTGVLSCFDALSGKVIWKERLEGRFSASPVLSDNKIMVTNEEGLTSIFKAGDNFELIAENDLKEETLASLAVLGEQIFIRTAKHLYCIAK